MLAVLAAWVGTFKFVFGVKFFSVCEYMEKIGTQYSTDLSACNGLQLLGFETKVTFLCWFVGLVFFPLFLAAPFSKDNAEAEFCPTLCTVQSRWSHSR